ncbi:hypothetical protein BX666DRAFT_1966302 [Dichotomocladium elegans]|nr:hypothetical protein BX666DRAFT_1966302 [Dichotomocladium elegans]
MATLTVPEFERYPSPKEGDIVDLSASSIRKSMSISLLSINMDEEKRHAQIHHHQYNSNSHQVLHDLHNEFLMQEESRKQASAQLRRYWFWWLRLSSVLLVLLYGIFILIASMVTYADGYRYATIIRIVHADILSLSVATACLCVLAAFVGIVCLSYHCNSSPTPSVIHAFLLWASLGLVCGIGYYAYKHDLDAADLLPDLHAQWHTLYTIEDHAALQKQLHCCGFDHPADKAAYHGHCRPDTLIPGCSYKMLLFEQTFLFKIRTVVLALIPVHTIVILVTLLCSTHLGDHLFGPSKPATATGKQSPT